MSTVDEKIRNILSALGIAEENTSCTKQFKKSDSTTKLSPKPLKKLPSKYCSGRLSDLLDEIEYYPDGNAPTEHNALRHFSDKKCYWFCSDKKVAFIDPKENKVVVIADNAKERFTTYVAKKWALERDWIPEYRYSFEDNKAEVWLTLQEAFTNGVDRSEMAKMCFDRLDYIYRAKPDKSKKLPKEENLNDAERLMYALLFTGDVNSLQHLASESGDLLPLPTEEDLLDFSEREIKQFEKIKVLFERTRSKHDSASVETWMSAQCYALNMPTKDAIRFIYGDRADGKKKYRRCEVAYSRQSNQVFTWLLEELDTMLQEGVGEGLEKWVSTLNRSVAMSWARKAYNLIKKYDLMGIKEKSPQEEALMSLIIVNPFKVKELLEEVLESAKEKHNYDFFAELDGTSREVEEPEEVEVVVTMNGPF